MTATIRWLLAGVVVALSTATASAATTICGSHDAIISALAEDYKEQRESMGLTENGLLVEVFVSESGSWTIVVSSPGGLTCIIAAGQSWERFAKPLPEA